jgi:hypothetical protein
LKLVSILTFHQMSTLKNKQSFVLKISYKYYLQNYSLAIVMVESKIKTTLHVLLEITECYDRYAKKESKISTRDEACFNKYEEYKY